jgi:hypothetical protein
MSSIVIQGDTSGSITVEAPSVAGTHTLTLPKATGNIATDATVGLGVKNLIINGDMRIDQRNSGSAVTVNANSVFYPVDRFHAVGVGSAGVFTAQQVSDAPDGGDKSLKFTVTTTASSGAYRFHHNIEGNHIAHLGFGQSWAKTFTLSFWVKSSVTGTYSGSFRNSAHNRSYVFEYTINTANTWERKTITITADTTGTWLTDNGSGLKIIWGLGSSSSGTAGSWQSANYFTSTNQTEWIATSGATFYISQVQLEVSENATPFENRMYGTELALCKRYFQKYTSLAMTPYWTTGILGPKFEVEMRAAPTSYWEYGGTANRLYRIQDAFQYTVSIAGAPTTTTSLQYIYDPSTTWTQIGTQISALTAAIMTFSAEL